jgi:hypothetical protein
MAAGPVKYPLLNSTYYIEVWLFTAIQSGFQSFSLFQDGAIQILELSGCFRTAGPVLGRLSVVQDGSG